MTRKRKYIIVRESTGRRRGGSGSVSGERSVRHAACMCMIGRNAVYMWGAHVPALWSHVWCVVERRKYFFKKRKQDIPLVFASIVRTKKVSLLDYVRFS